MAVTMTNPAATTFSSEQWQAKVEELQAQHQLELLQQQEEHLHLLQQLKAQLIKDIADANASGDAVPDPSQVLQALFSTEEIPTQAFPGNKGLAISGYPLQSDLDLESQRASLGITKCTASPSRTSCAPSPAKATESSAGQRCDDFDSLPRTPIRVSTPEYMPANPSTPPPNRHPVQTPLSCEHSLYQTPWSNASELKRAALMEKHTKHIEDLKQYYESELAALKQQLEEAQSNKEKRMASNGSPVPPGPKNHTKSVDIDKLMSGNVELQLHCSDLQQLHEEDTRERQALEIRLHKLQQYAERYELSEKKASVLQERLEATRSSLEQQEELVKSLQQELTDLKMELNSYQEQRTQDLESVEQLLKEFEVLQRDDEVLHETNTSLENTVAEMNQEIYALRSTLNKYKAAETQYKTTINGLEDEVRHLRHVNNRLHGQTTHYSLSDQDTNSKTSDVSRSPYEASSTPSRPRSSPYEASSTPSRPRSSPYRHTQTPPSRTPPLAEQSSISSQKLTRRKWLEPSEPGLIFGKEPVHNEGAEDQVPQSKAKSRSPSYIGLEEGPSSVHDVLQKDKGGDPDGTTVDLAESSLQSIRSGHILALEPSRQKAYQKSKAGSTPTNKYNADLTSLEERVERNLQVITKAEQKMAELQKEREQLQSALQRIPPRSGRTTLHDKQDQLQMETRLDEVDKEIGALRMTLRNHHAL